MRSFSSARDAPQDKDNRFLSFIHHINDAVSEPLPSLAFGTTAANRKHCV